jgi:hypothetical protein
LGWANFFPEKFLMAHECPDCTTVCHCGGDIDDMLMNDTTEERACTHFRRCKPEEVYDDADFDDDVTDLDSYVRSL